MTNPFLFSFSRGLQWGIMRLVSAVIVTVGLVIIYRLLRIGQPRMYHRRMPKMPAGFSPRRRNYY